MSAKYAKKSIATRHCSCFSLDNFDSQELIDVCVNQFIPELSEATKSWRPLPEAQRLEIGGNLAGTFAKLIYAFLWQVGALLFCMKW